MIATMTTKELLAEAEEWADGFGESALKMSGDKYHREMGVANIITLLIDKIEKLEKENEQSNINHKARIKELKAAIEEGKMGGLNLNQSFVEGVDKGIDWAISVIEADFEEDESNYV